MLTIGQVAKQSDLGIETVRYYERQGLLAEPDRTASGYRQYTDKVLHRLYFIKQAKELGFTLKEIKELLSLRNETKSDCAQMKAIAEKKVGEINEKILILQCMKKALLKVSKTCPGKGPVSNCPILDAITKTDKK